MTTDNDFGERTWSTPCVGVVGTRVLYAPLLPFHTTPADTFPRPYAHQWWNWESDPVNDTLKYEYMKGDHPFSLGMKFMPHPFDYSAGAPVYDYRYLQSWGPFSNWEDQEVKKFVMVTGVGRGLEGMRRVMDNAMIAYYSGNPEQIGDPVLVYQNPEQYGSQLGFTGTSDSDIVNDGHFMVPQSSVEEGKPELPASFSIDRVYPNPFNPTLTVSVTLPGTKDLTVSMYNVLGEKVGELIHGRVASGTHNLTFDGSALASGIYFVHASVPGEMTVVRKTVLLK